ncbi:serine/threonine-protein kinase [Nocardia cyriacigeorgica]|uniref:serine/threonine-protein kinase n=1 Tax=Nocardia cyriacigeorgica TaxID=135487 RepID=UPI002810CB64|nr:serine/threonine-protein kinase [Nocardia cyriacigeorgica]
MQPGSVFAGYQIERRLGRGGMGSVYLAKHPRLPRRTALKLLNPDLFDDKETRARFEREADLAAQLDHPNIVTVFDRGVEDAQLWISMQYIDGVDAASLDPNTLPVMRAVRIIADTAQALDFAHSMGVLHRDVKPANIMLSNAHTGPERVYLTDFGIARLRDDGGHLTQTGSFTATIAYASPEQLTGAPLDHRTDQYSLACSLFWMLTGTAPFNSPHPVAVIQGHLQHSPPALSSVRLGMPAALDAVMARALAKRPEERFGSCAEFAEAVRAALSGAAPVSGPHGRVATTMQAPMATAQGQRIQPQPQPQPQPRPPHLSQPHSQPQPRPPHLSQPHTVGTIHGSVGTSSVTAGTGPGMRPMAGPLTPPRQQVYSPPTGELSATTGALSPMRKADGDGLRSRRKRTIGLSVVAVLAVIATIVALVVMDTSDDSAPAPTGAISTEFPRMVPRTSPGNGFAEAGCVSHDAAKEEELWDGQASTGPDFGAWSAAWGCMGTDGLTATSYYLVEYETADEVRRVLDGLQPIDITHDALGGVTYPNYHLPQSMGHQHTMMTSFPGPPRGTFLLYTMGMHKSPEDFMDWWKSLPLS